MAGQGKQTSAERRRERAAAQRAAALAAARKRRLRMIGGFVAVVLLAGAVLGAVLGIKSLMDDDDTAVAQDEPTASSTPTPAPAGKVNCDYVARGTASKDVGKPPAVAEATGKYKATLTINKKPVVWELDAAKAPCAVNSFVYLAKAGYFDDTICHRMLDNEADDKLGTLEAHVLQCGDPDGSGRGGPGYSFADENLTGATYEKGVVAMANSGPNSNGSQFFMMFGESGFPPSYVPFAKILSGIEVLTAAAKGGTTGANDDEPKTKVTISKVVIEETPGKGKATGKASAKATPKASSTPASTSSPEPTS